MLSVGETVRVLMEEREMTLSDLAQKTQLKETAIQNVIYNRTNRVEYLNKIAHALNVSLDTILRAKKSFLIDIKIYITTIETVKTVLNDLKILQIPSSVLQEYIDSTYKHISEKSDISSATSYLKGMAEGHIKFGIIQNTQCRK